MSREKEYTNNEVLSCTSCLADYAAFLFSAVALAWFFYSFILELIADFNLENELTFLQCYSTNVDWEKVAVFLGLPKNTNLTEADLKNYNTGSGYLVNGTYIPFTEMECNMDMEVSALNFFIVAAVINVIAFMIIASCLTCYKFSLFSNCRIDKKKERAADRVDKALGIQQITSVIFSITKILVYLSVLNKLLYLGMWDSENDFFSLADFGITVLFGNPTYTTVADRVKGDLVKTAFNIFRTYWFFQALYFAHGDGCSLLINSVRCLIVMFPATILWTIKAIADAGIFHYTQQYYTESGNFTLEPRINIAIANVCFGSATLLIIFYYNVMTVWASEHLVQAHKKGHNRLTRLLFCFPLIFIIVCFLGPIVLWIGDPQGLTFEVLFIMAMASNGVLAVVILVGICNPSCYRHVVLCAIGDPEFKTFKKKNKEEMLESPEVLQS